MFAGMFASRLGIWIVVAVVGTGMILGLWGWQTLNDPLIFPIHRVKVEGEFIYVKRDAVQQVLLPVVGNGFFAADLSTMSKELLSMPWVGKVFVRRVWPDGLLVRIEEKKPFAHWGKGQLLARDGDLFTPDNAAVAGDLPWFWGPQGSRNLVLTNYLDMNKMLAGINVTIKQIELTMPHAWRLWLSNGMRLELGKEDALQRLQRFIAVYPQLFAAAPKNGVDYVDLRYSNGMAVRWRDH